MNEPFTDNVFLGQMWKTSKKRPIKIPSSLNSALNR